ncbi:di-trans,poly-cis-decaprenylcistransferase [Candidatus Micrarchaeota archaeon RBG_16_36_9]|nr:MAG: di-trans,poly-cis-decaprenylcistransferase [Candidatus Micrarchaeota archaeon RBG_16_36_9]
MKGLIVPNHLGIILDGNRRWGLRHKMEAWRGHYFGAEKFEDFLEWCADMNIPQVSAYVLSSENLDRSDREVKELFNLFQRELEKLENEKKSFLDKYEIRMKFIGDLTRLPLPLRKVMGRIMKKTEKYNKRVFNLLVAYGGKFELTRAVKMIAKKAMEKGVITITQKTIKNNLLIKDDVDLLIRTGAQQRLSNFMPWQTAYAEMIVLRKYWPDFTKQDLIRCIKEYSRRQRKFGY